MRYVYKAAWAIIGGVALPNDEDTFELPRTNRCRFLLTARPSESLTDVDRGSAIARLMLKNMVGQGRAAEFPVALDEEIAEIREERRKKLGASAVLIFEGFGDVDATVQGPIRDHGQFIVTCDAFDKEAVRRAHRPSIDAMKLAVALEGSMAPRYVSVCDGAYLVDDSGRQVYSINFSGSADVTVSTGLSKEAIERISLRHIALQLRTLESVQRLFSAMSESQVDKLKAFLFGWTALEILIAKSFKAYEEAFLAPLANGGQLAMRQRLLERIRSVMEDKYRVTDKFTVVMAVLFPHASDGEAQEDLRKFGQLKTVRDSIAHGREVPERDLPVQEVSDLLRKYVIAHLDQVALADNR